jgi:hypothetical protein
MRNLRTYTTALVAFAAGCLAFAAPASAHNDPVGDGGPFRIEITEGLPAEIEAKWGNGEVEFHVPTGTELVAIGAEGEQFVKVDAEGNMFFNGVSPTWWLNMDASMIPATADAKAEPQWEWKQGGGGLQYHDHRIHFMAASIADDINDGDNVFEFSLPFLVNGTETTVRGALVFDSTLDPEGAAALRAGTGMTSMEHGDDADHGSSSNGTVIVIAIAALAAVAAGAAVFARKKR